jgi:glutathione peroxidase-family protein
LNTDIVYKFTGERGSFVVGAPARDIAEWEVMAEPEIAKVVEANMKTTGAIYSKVAKVTTKATKAAVAPAVVEPVTEVATNA